MLIPLSVQAGAGDFVLAGMNADLGAPPVLGAGHNGGRTQVNLGFPANAGDYPFINVLKTAQDITYADTGLNPRPDTLTANGYPSIIIASGIKVLTSIPYLDDRPGNYVCKWKGAAGTQVIANGTTVSGSTTAPSLDAGRFVFTPSGSSLFVIIKTTGVDDVVVCHVNDETAYDGGERFGVRFKARLIEGNFGCIRHMNTQQCNDGNIGQWKHRNSVNYVTYGGRQWRSDIYAGNTTTVGAAFTTGNTPGGFVLEDRTIVHFNVVASSAAAEPWTLNVNGTGAKPMVSKYINGGVNPSPGMWSAVYDAVLQSWITEQGGILNGWPVEMQLRLCAEVGAHCHFSSPTYAFETCPDYWHTGLATYCRDNKPAWMTIIMEGPNETWNVSSGVNQIQYATGKQFKRNGGQVYPYIPPSAQTYAISVITKPSTAMGTGYVDLLISSAATLNIGATLQTNNIDAYGTINFSYNQLYVVAKNVGGNANRITCKHINDFTSSGYTGSGGTVESNSYDHHGWYGRGLAQMGAAWAAVFGLGNKGWPHYAITCGVQSVQGDTPSGPDGWRERFDCNSWVIEGGTAPKTYTTAYCPANYYASLAQVNTLSEVEDAFAYHVTQRGNPTAQAALLAAYVNHLTDATVGPYNLAYLRTLYANWKTYVLTKGVNRCFAYEGGYSPDFMSEYFPIQDWTNMATSTVVGASKATSCVLTLGTSYLMAAYSRNDPNYTFAGVNPMKPGMLLCLRNILGMTQLNCGSTTNGAPNPSAVPIAITGGGSADITWTGVDPVPVVGQGIVFLPVNNFIGIAEPLGTNRYPPPLVPRLPYYVVYSSGTTIRIALTKGSSTPITFTLGATAVDNNLGAISGWIVLSKSGTQVTIDCDSTGFSTWTSGAAQFAHVACSDGMLNVFRSASKNAPEMMAVNTQSYTDFLSYTDGSFTMQFPSNYLFTSLGSKHVGYIGYDGNVWSIQCDLYQSPDSAQYASAKAFNH
jgi:hypothetical protein